MVKKCALCKRKIDTTILGKINGTYIKEGKKIYPICNVCQRDYPNLKTEKWLEIIKYKRDKKDKERE